MKTGARGTDGADGRGVDAEDEGAEVEDAGARVYGRGAYASARSQSDILRGDLSSIVGSWVVCTLCTRARTTTTPCRTDIPEAVITCGETRGIGDANKR